MVEVGYVNYLVILFMITGLLIVFFEVKGFKRSKLMKESKVARWLGWTNVGFGAIVFLANWTYRNFFW